MEPPPGPRPAYSFDVTDPAQLLDDRTLFERGPVVIFKWRNEAGWPVEYVSQNVVEVFGYSAAEFHAGTVAYGEIVFEADLPRVGREVQEASASADVHSFAHEPYRVRRRDGELIWLYDYTHLLRDREGRATHFLGYVFDVTSHVRAEAERHELERRLLHAQKLESLGVLAGGVAHDFNNLLTGILGQASVARQELGAAQPASGRAEAVDRALSHIEQLALRAADLTKKLLAYSGKGTVVIEAVDLGRVLDELASMLDVAISKKATVVRKLAPNLPAVKADRAQLEQVVLNLLTNASDALGDGEGTIELVTCTRIVDADTARRLEIAPGTYVSFTVSDTGCGMSEEAKARLFEPFFTTKFAGRGLGMSAVLGIVRGHRGAIEVTSEVGAGARFEVLIPSTTERAAPAKEAPRGSAWKGEGTIVVADDQPAIRKTLGLLLASLGFTCVEASNGQRAIDLYREHRADVVLVLLDMTMPVLSGVEALRVLRSLDSSLPVILSTGYSEEDVTERAAGEPVVFLQKPYQLEELEDALRTALAMRG